MSDAVLVTTDPQHFAFIHVVCPKDKIAEVMGPTLQELHAHLGSLSMKPTGPWFTHHNRIAPGAWDFEICLPIADGTGFKPGARAQFGTWEATRVAKKAYKGGYEGLGAAWGEFIEWLNDNGHKGAQDLYEVYVAGPELSSDSAQWHTELIKPLL